MSITAVMDKVKRDKMEKPSEVELAYLAGIIDGEGSISFSKSYSVDIKIANTDFLLMEYIFKIYNKIDIHKKIELLKNNVKGKNWKVGFQIRINKKEDALKLLKYVFPYLICKKQKALTMICYLESRISKLECYNKLKILNRKGV